MSSKEQELLVACANGDLDLVKSLSNEAPIWFEDDNGKGCLHYAVEGRHLPIVEYLLTDGGCPWNTIDKQGKTAADTARATGDTEIYDAIVRAGLRAELLLNLLGRKETEQDDTTPNADYLSSKLEYTADEHGQLKLIDADKNGVMMGWEADIMRESARVLCENRTDLDVLNVGFGLGLVDTELQKYKPRTHTIIEPHPDVIAEMKRQGWDKKPGVKIIQARWQDALPELEAYDAIYADTFGEFYADLRAFHEELPNLVKDHTSRYSFFHGLGADQQLFYDVYTQVVELELRDIGLGTTWQTIPMTNSSDTWNGIKKRYWTLDEYRLPLCTMEVM